MTETPIEPALRTLRVTPALCGAVAVVAAFFMPLLGVANFFSTTGWGYLRLTTQTDGRLKTGEEILFGTLAAVGMLAVGVVITEIAAKRSRVLLFVAGITPFGLAIYLLIKTHTWEVFQYVDIGAYVGIAGAIVMLASAGGVLDRGDRNTRIGVYAVSAATALAGVLVPMFVAPSFEEGFTNTFGDNKTTTVDRPITATVDSGSFDGDVISRSAIENRLSRELETRQFVDSYVPVDCPSDIARREGAIIVCTFPDFDNGDTLEVAATIESVDDGDFTLSLVVGPQ